ncbi:hypothetical protein RFI_32254 [Reticulomyxa filosa]|uniref:Rad60/SUMO-like domain-containing protein n=1 Tax=Reticulomyxa filosa TaxID=46433 RepID=X6LVG4_RETFI|nr:hypothetical protein RFI_32254 [Reticulomyxa filosa]|eukprot:ETO05142.1 hypothetical protein RFI_32254 [Reticulomyxa filosa]
MQQAKEDSSEQFEEEWDVEKFDSLVKMQVMEKCNQKKKELDEMRQQLKLRYEQTPCEKSEIKEEEEEESFGLYDVSNDPISDIEEKANEKKAAKSGKDINIKKKKKKRKRATNDNEPFSSALDTFFFTLTLFPKCYIKTHQKKEKRETIERGGETSKKKKFFKIKKNKRRKEANVIEELLSDCAKNKTEVQCEDHNNSDFAKQYEMQLHALEQLERSLNTPSESDNETKKGGAKPSCATNQLTIESDDVVMIKVTKPDGQHLSVRIFRNDNVGKIIASLEAKYELNVQLKFAGKVISPDTRIKDLEIENGVLIDTLYSKKETQHEKTM